MASNIKYALVKWTSGEDTGLLTIVDIDWIRGYEKIEFDSTGAPGDSNPLLVMLLPLGFVRFERIF